MKKQHSKLIEFLKGKKENMLQVLGKTRMLQATPDIMAHIDEPRNHQASWSRVLVRGWAIPPKKIKWIEVGRDDESIAKIKIGNDLRPDLTSEFPSILDAKYGGFATPIKLGFNEGKYKLAFSAISTEGKIKLGEKIVVNSKSIINHPPENCSIALTTRCNLSCVMCPIYSNPDLKKSLDMNRSTLDIILNGLEYYSSHIKHVDLTPTYGEPFIYRDIFKVINRVHEVCPNAQISVTTNGTMLTDSVIKEILNSKLTDIVISLDAGSKMTYERIRKGANFENTISGLRRLINIRNYQKKKLPRIATNFTLMRSNIHEFPDYVRISTGAGVDYILATNAGGLYDSDNKEFIYIISGSQKKLSKNYTNFIQEAEKIAEKANIEYHIPSLTPSEPKLDCHYKARCNPYIDASGFVYQCCVLVTIARAREYVRERSVKPIGNLHQNTLSEIWESKPYRHFREAFFTGNIPNPICVKCPKYYDM